MSSTNLLVWGMNVLWQLRYVCVTMATCHVTTLNNGNVPCDLPQDVISLIATGYTKLIVARCIQLHLLDQHCTDTPHACLHAGCYYMAQAPGQQAWERKRREPGVTVLRGNDLIYQTHECIKISLCTIITTVYINKEKLYIEWHFKAFTLTEYIRQHQSLDIYLYT